jgi:hypothetical protein
VKRATLAGFIDESLPPDLGELLAHHGIDPEAFARWFGPQLGRYRASELARTTMPTVSDERAWMRETAQMMREVGARLQVCDRPPRGDAHAYAAACRLGLEWPELVGRLQNDLRSCAAVLAAAERQMPAPGNGGRPSMHARRELLQALVQRLRAEPMTAKKARQVAELVLIRCKVRMPEANAEDGHRSIRRAEGSPGR